MAPWQIHTPKKNMLSRIEHMRTFFRVVAEQREFFTLSLKSIEFWFGIKPRSINKLLRHCLSDVTYHLFRDKNRIYLISFGPKTKIGTSELLDSLGSFHQCLNKFMNSDKVRTRDFLPFAELMVIFRDFSSFWDLGAQQLSRLLYFLDFYGLHATGRLLCEQANEKGFILELPVWGQMRLGIVDETQKEPWVYAQAEKSDANIIGDLRLQSSLLKLWPLTHFGIFLLSLVGLARVLFWALRGGFRSADTAFEDQKLASTDNKHWAWSSKLLANYWFNARLSRDMSARMVVSSVFGPSLSTLVRSIDWYFYCQSHCSADRLMSWLSKAIMVVNKSHLPFLYPDTVMRLGILHYFLGNIKKSIKYHALVESLLCDGHHPFNRVTNLSTSMRSSLPLKSPRLTTGLYRNLIKIPQFQTGMMAKRAKICAIIQWLQEENSINSYQSTFADVEQSIINMGPLPRGTIELLLCVVGITNDNSEMAKQYFSRAVKSIKQAKQKYAYRRIIALLDILVRAKDHRIGKFNIHKGWKASWGGFLRLRRISDLSGISTKEWRMLSFQFGQFGLMENEETHLIDISASITRAHTGKELRNAIHSLIEKWLPEFRFRISCEDEIFENEPKLPQSVMAEIEKAHNIRNSSGVSSYVISSQGSIEWVYFVDSITLDNSCHRIILATPRKDRTHTSLRFSLAHNLVQMYCQSVARVFWAEEALKRAKFSAIAKVAQMVAHDIRSPLAALSVVEKDLAGVSKETRTVMRSAVNRIKDISNDLFERYRREDDIGFNDSKPKKHNEPTECLLLTSLVDPLISEKRFQFQSMSDIKIDWQLDSSSFGLFAKVQAKQFRRILSNLINNAVEALDKRGQILVKIRGMKDSVELNIEDNGKGIPPHILPQLGQYGVSVGKSHGSGLGLYHARTTIESWNGKLHIKSKQDHGTTVKITLPREKTPHWFISELRLNPNSNVVILNDDTSVHHVWQKRFDSVGIDKEDITVHYFSTPLQLISWVAHNLPAIESTLFLMDNELQGHQETGLSLIKSLNIGQRSILVTSCFEDRTILDDCLRLNVKFLPKLMAGFIPLSIKNTSCKKLDHILIDDDPLVRMTWELAANRMGKQIKTYESAPTFFDQADYFDKKTPVYIDSNLGDCPRGEDVSHDLYKMGFHNLFITTGSKPDKFRSLTHIRGVCNKNSPV